MERDDAYLLDMLKGAREIQHICAGVHQLAVVKLIEVIGEAARAISEGTQNAHPEIPWVRIIDMRNHLIHRYFRIELERVWAVVENHIAPRAPTCKSGAKWPRNSGFTRRSETTTQRRPAKSNPPTTSIKSARSTRAPTRSGPARKTSDFANSLAPVTIQKKSARFFIVNPARSEAACPNLGFCRTTESHSYPRQQPTAQLFVAVLSRLPADFAPATGKNSEQPSSSFTTIRSHSFPNWEPACVGLTADIGYLPSDKYKGTAIFKPRAGK